MHACFAIPLHCQDQTGPHTSILHTQTPTTRKGDVVEIGVRGTVSLTHTISHTHPRLTVRETVRDAGDGLAGHRHTSLYCNTSLCYTQSKRIGVSLLVMVKQREREREQSCPFNNSPGHFSSSLSPFFSCCSLFSCIPSSHVSRLPVPGRRGGEESDIVSMNFSTTPSPAGSRRQPANTYNRYRHTHTHTLILIQSETTDVLCQGACLYVFVCRVLRFKEVACTSSLVFSLFSIL